MAVTYFQTNAEGGNGGIEAGTLLAGRFQNTAGTGSLVEIGISLHSSYAGDIRLGIYNDETSSQPGTLLYDAGVLSAPGSGWQTRQIVTSPPTVTLNDYYWLVFICSTDTPAYVNFDQEADGTPNKYWAPQSGGYGALVADFPTVTGGEGGRVLMRGGVQGWEAVLGQNVTTTITMNWA